MLEVRRLSANHLKCVILGEDVVDARDEELGNLNETSHSDDQEFLQNLYILQMKDKDAKNQAALCGILKLIKSLNLLASYSYRRLNIDLYFSRASIGSIQGQTLLDF